MSQPMAKSSSQTLSAYKPRTFTRNDLIYVHKSSPRQPYLSFTIGPYTLRRLIIKIWSHDQGPNSALPSLDTQYETDQPYANSHTWFALGIVPESSDPLRPPDEPYLCEIQRNVRASTEKKCHVLEWRLNTPFEGDQSHENEAQGWLESISSGSRVRVGVFPLARHSGWVNVVYQVEVELYDDTDRMMSPATAHVLDSMSNHDPDIGADLIDMAISLGERYERTKSIEDLTRVIEATQKANEATPDNDPNLAIGLSNLGAWLCRRYDLTQSIDDLSRAIRVAQEAIKVATDDHPNLITFLKNLVQWLGKRYERLQETDDLRRSIEVAKQAVEAMPDDNTDLAEVLDSLGNNLGINYKATGRIDDLASAIEACDRAVKTAPDWHPNRPAYLGNLGVWLNARFEAISSMEDLERAIEVTRTAVETTPDADYKDYAKYLTNLGTLLGYRSEQKDSADDLDTGIELSERAIELMREGHPALACSLSNLGKLLSRKFYQTGSADTLARAIEVNQEAIKAAHSNPTHYNVQNLAQYLNNLGESLFKRHEQTGSTDDLKRAVKTFQEAVEAAPDGYPVLAIAFSSLAVCLGKRYEQTKSADDLEGAIEAAEKAVEATPHDNITLAGKLSNLSIQLARRYELTGEMDDLTRAIKVTEQAIATTDLATLHLCWTNLGNWLDLLYDETRSMDDLLNAVKAFRKAVDATPHGHTSRALYLMRLGDTLGLLYAQTCAKADQDAQFLAYVEAWHCTTSPPSHRILSANNAARIKASREEWDEAYHLLRESVLLLPKLSPRSLEQSDAQRMLSFTSGLATDTAAMALNAEKDVSEALSILELGRGVIAGLLIDTRGDLSGLRAVHPSLADRFDALRQELDSPSQNSGSTDELSTINRRHQASHELDEVIERIRAQNGFQDFLQPPSAKSLMAVAELGPIVVINVSPYRCDAILVERETIRLLEIENLTLDWGIAGSKDYPWPSLEWIWTTVCQPCLDALGFTEPLGDKQWPHVWWVPTGSLSYWPLHAAGIYPPESKETVLDRVVSSYASSLKALQHVRQQRREVIDKHAQRNAAVLVAMDHTEGQISLPNARTEVDKVRALCPLLHLNATTPPPRKADILEHLEKCKILHFAGHGESGRDPSQSCLLLEDWKTNPLTVSDLRQSWLQESPAFLAYLSACSTGRTPVRGLSDEAIHLVSAFQLAGFRHVVGTLWEVSDPHCVDVAAVLYQTLCDEGMTDESVSIGLHRAIRKLRDGSFQEGVKRDAEREDKRPTPGFSANTYWIPYVHFGA